MSFQLILYVNTSFSVSGSSPLFFYPIHLRGRGKKRVRCWDTLKNVPLPSLGFSLFLELSLYDPGFLSQLLAQGQILNLGLDNKSTAEVISTTLKRLSAL